MLELVSHYNSFVRLSTKYKAHLGHEFLNHPIILLSIFNCIFRNLNRKIIFNSFSFPTTFISFQITYVPFLPLFWFPFFKISWLWGGTWINNIYTLIINLLILLGSIDNVQQIDLSQAGKRLQLLCGYIDLTKDLLVQNTCILLTSTYTLFPEHIDIHYLLLVSVMTSLLVVCTLWLDCKWLLL